MNGLLLDTHVFLWFANGDSKLPARFVQAIQNEHGQVCVSIVSAWEIAIKVGLGKLQLGLSLADLFGPSMSAAGIELIPLRLDEIEAYAHLPFYSEHRDPFDRMLVVQANLRNLQLLTLDEAFAPYPVEFLQP